MDLVCIFSTGAVGILVFLILRLLWILRSRHNLPPHTHPLKTLVVLGSGGHTAEMNTLLDKLNKDWYSPRVYVVAETDSMSAAKALSKEKLWQSTESPTDFHVRQIPRSREVGQSYLTSVVTTLYSLLFAFLLVLKERPKLVLVNGPGTCIPICVAAFTYRLLGLSNSRIVYVESIARTRRFSLSAKILYHLRIADMLFVQWEQLAKTYPRAQYAGRLY